MKKKKQKPGGILYWFNQKNKKQKKNGMKNL